MLCYFLLFHFKEMSRLSKLFVYLLLLVFIGSIIRSCNSEKRAKNARQASFVARVGRQYLHASDLELLDISCIDPADKALLVNQYAEEWACKQLIIGQVNKKEGEIQSTIESKISEYKNDLFVHHFLETLVKREFNDNVSPEAIADYYHKHKKKDFILNHDIVKGIFVAIPKRAAGVNFLKPLMLSKKSIDYQRLRTYCKPYVHTSVLESDRWFSWEAVLAKLGYRPIGDATRLLKTNRFIHVVGRNYVYLLRIDQYKIAREVAPIEAVADRIKAIVLHKRRLGLISKIKSNLLQNAKKNHTCVIHGS